MFRGCPHWRRDAECERGVGLEYQAYLGEFETLVRGTTAHWTDRALMAISPGTRGAPGTAPRLSAVDPEAMGPAHSKGCAAPTTCGTISELLPGAGVPRPDVGAAAAEVSGGGPDPVQAEIMKTTAAKARAVQRRLFRSLFPMEEL